MSVQKILPKTPYSLKPSTTVTDFEDKYVQQAIQDLLDTLAAYQLELDKIRPGYGAGVGLASNQIEYPYQPVSAEDPSPKEGFYPKDFVPLNMYVISVRKERATNEGCRTVPPTIYVNASYKNLAGSVKLKEGCLSVKGIFGINVPRDDKIEITAFDANGKKIRFIEEGFIARVHQHEIDHGEGKEFLNQLNFTTAELEAILMKIEENRHNKTINADITILPEKLIACPPSVDWTSLEMWTKAELEQLTKSNTNKKTLFGNNQNGSTQSSSTSKAQHFRIM